MGRHGWLSWYLLPYAVQLCDGAPLCVHRRPRGRDGGGGGAGGPRLCAGPRSALGGACGRCGQLHDKRTLAATLLYCNARPPSWMPCCCTVPPVRPCTARPVAGMFEPPPPNAFAVATTAGLVLNNLSTLLFMSNYTAVLPPTDALCVRIGVPSSYTG